MTVRLAQLTDADAEPTARWREAARPYLRTPYVRTVEEQREFIRTLHEHRYEYRYWAVQRDEGYDPQQTVGLAGLSPIQWENGIAEVSLVLDPACVGKGYGGQAFALLLAEAFDYLRLEQVVAEVYANNPAMGFWDRMARKHGADSRVLPKRKYSGGVFHAAVYFSFQKRAWGRHKP